MRNSFSKNFFSLAHLQSASRRGRASTNDLTHHFNRSLMAMVTEALNRLTSQTPIEMQCDGASLMMLQKLRRVVYDIIRGHFEAHRSGAFANHQINVYSGRSKYLVRSTESVFDFCLPDIVIPGDCIHCKQPLY